ncbi:MAG TPA: FecR family protein [Candidatus Sulfotelmatobacter sp.]|nr:FecR family protein [Candidatus Sulfotelmatobacter sp.]
MSTASPSRITFILLAAAVCVLVALPVFADSQARIVRLSDIQGSVQIDKNTGAGFESAFVNLPITQGTQLRTGDRGRAEIEFEDGSSLRLTPNTTVEFSKLSLSDSGKRVSEVHLVKGMAYVNWLGKDDLALNFSQQKVAVDRSAHFRVDTSTELANLAVFKGNVDVDGPSGKLSLEKKKNASFDVAENDKSTVTNKIEEAPLDSWDKEASSYHDQYAKNNNNSPYGYGLADLNYYGAYSNVPGYGMMWQPYFAGASWDPFMDGAWGFYPGYGYMFASAYPWGWLPYRYGTWAFVPGFGWGWQPGMWTSFVAVPRYIPTAATHVTTLIPPGAGTVRTVTVGRVGTVSPVMSPNVRLSAGSAGMGIPRGSVDNLNHLNHQVVKSGYVEVRPAPQFAATPAARSASYSGGAYAPARSGAGPAPSSVGHSAPPSHPSSGGPVRH